jgi:hypothetical protein
MGQREGCWDGVCSIQAKASNSRSEEAGAGAERRIVTKLDIPESPMCGATTRVALGADSTEHSEC